MTMRKSACRVGGGGSAPGSRNVSPTPKARVPVVMLIASRYRRSILVPTLWQSQQLRGGQLNQCQGLLTFRDQHVIARTRDLERTPKSYTLDAIEPTVDNEKIAQSCGAPIIDFCSKNDGILLFFRHLAQLQSKL